MQPIDDQGYESAEVARKPKNKRIQHSRSGSNGLNKGGNRICYSNDEDESETEYSTVRPRRISRRQSSKENDDISKYTKRLPEHSMMANPTTMNSLLGIVALVILFLIVIWQSILLHLKSI